MRIRSPGPVHLLDLVADYRAHIPMRRHIGDLERRKTNQPNDSLARILRVGTGSKLQFIIQLYASQIHKRPKYGKADGNPMLGHRQGRHFADFFHHRRPYFRIFRPCRKCQQLFHQQRSGGAFRVKAGHRGHRAPSGQDLREKGIFFFDSGI